MDIAPLTIPLVRQEPKSDDCLRACAQMVFAYFKDPITSAEIWHKLHVYKKHSGLRGGYLWDLGRLALKKGYDCEILHSDWHWWNKTVVEANTKTQKALITALKNLKKDKTDWAQKQEVAKEIKYVISGGKYRFDRPTAKIIDEYLINRIPVIINVRSEDFYQNPKEDYAHSVVIIGKTGKNYLIRDPYFAVNDISEDDLIFACIRTGGWLMTILPTDKVKRLAKTPDRVHQEQLI